MLKFIKKQHYKKGAHPGKIVITYSASEIIMGGMLIFATALHIYIYLSTVSQAKKNHPIPYTLTAPADNQVPGKTAAPKALK